MNIARTGRLELWGGAECTLNRVHDRFFNQLDRTGHSVRSDDLELFAELGIRTLRYPILWEKIAPESLEECDWRWADERLGKLRELGIRPIVGFVHHGSGPGYTSLVDPQFPQKLARFARMVGERYPWVDAFTPVNEPLTTARFSGLYGHWYPHGRDELTFARALLHQCLGTALAMREIRQINPHALLVQTDDLGKTFSAPKLQYQADFDNERRWLTWDLLAGKVTREHAMWGHLGGAVDHRKELETLAQNPCAPDVIGVNYYVTSERFLDHNLSRYPADTFGGNGRDRYADVGAVGARHEGLAGPAEVLREACDRYDLPVAVTEAHLGCTREEQMRWFMEVWRAATALRDEGRDLLAVTAWSLLGAYDWDSLVTADVGHYEPGVFDLRGGAPRPTALAEMLRQLARGETFNHPVLSMPGWWHRSARLLHQREARESGVNVVPFIPASAWDYECDNRPLLITGAGGRLARIFAEGTRSRGLATRLLSRDDLDITDTGAVASAFAAFKPWAVINCAGFSRIEEAETDEAECFRSNVEGLNVLAAASALIDIPLVTFSSDLVFDGAKRTPYTERDPKNPLNALARSKASADRQTFCVHPRTLIVRAGELFGGSENDFLNRTLTGISRGERIHTPNDVVLSPTYAPDLVNATLDLLIDGETGVWHLANNGAVSPYEFATAAARLAQLDERMIVPVPMWSLHLRAQYPRYRALASERAQILPSLDDALGRNNLVAPIVQTCDSRALVNS
ncbi:MAG: family 1 glycosylhydrolase [Chthoniobacterales bacterium]